MQLPQRPIAKVFISSANEVKAQRIEARKVIESLINPLLVRHNLFLRLDPYFWEDTPAQKAGGESVNQIFVNEINTSQLAIVLIGDRLGKGTAEELERALERDEVDVAIIKLTNKTPQALRRILKNWPDKVLWVDVPEADPSWLHITRPILNLCFRWLASENGRQFYVDSVD
jgi:hypothetical protein